MSNEIATYQPIDLEALEAELSRTRVSNRAILKLNEGVHTMRVLPGFDGMPYPFVIVAEHLIEIPGIGWQSWVCPHVHAKRPCATCQKAQKLSQSNNTTDQEFANKMMPGQRAYANVLYLEGNDAQPGAVAVYPFPTGVVKDLVRLLKNRHWGDFAHPNTGYPVTLTVGGKNARPKYKLDPVPTRGPLATLPDGRADVEAIEAILDQRRPLLPYSNVLSDDDIARKMRGEKPLNLGAGANTPTNALPARAATASPVKRPDPLDE